MAELYEKFKSNIKKYDMIAPEKTVVLYFSGGNDSSALLDLLRRYRDEVDFDLRPYMFHYPKVAIREDACLELKNYWKEKGVDITLLDMPYPDEINVEGTACYTCMANRRKYLAEYIPQTFDLKNLIITGGHNIKQDVNQYLAELLLLKYAPDFSEQNRLARKLLIGWRIYPKKVFSPGHTVVRPMMDINDREIANYIEERGIPILRSKCPYLKKNYKRFFIEFLHHLGTDGMPTEDALRIAEQHGLLPTEQEWQAMPHHMYY